MQRRAWLRLCGGALVVVLWAGTTAGPAAAGGGGGPCPEASPTYLSNCGPTFVLPAWGDAGGWTDPSKYSTIQLADFNGDGHDELIARNDQGLEVFWFDTTVGQWRPQVDAKAIPQVINDFRSPLPNETPATDWTQAQYYSTIQTAHLNGSKGAQILARFADGMRVYAFNPGPGGSINGGSWSLVNQGGPFSDQDGWNYSWRFLTIRTGTIDQANAVATVLLGRGPDGVLPYGWNGSGWFPLTGFAYPAFSDAYCGAPSCYELFGILKFEGPPEFPGQPTNDAALGRTSYGGEVYWYDSSYGGWPGLGLNGSITGDGPFTDISGRSDCPFPGTSDCLGSSPYYYETFRGADVDGDGNDEIIARAADGVRVKKVAFASVSPLATLTDLAGAASNVYPGLAGGLRTGDINGDGREEVLALNGSGLDAWSYQPASNTWVNLPGSVGLTTSPWLTNAEYYSTIQVGDVDGDGHEDVVARGPYGIRTWFYNRRGTGNWERYLADGYPAFPGSPTTGQQGAFAKLTSLAQNDGVIPLSASSVRSVWTGETAPQASDLQTLQQGVLSLAGCAGLNPGAPPSYNSCTPPTGSSGFDAADWTAVINEVLAEIAAATTVVNHFAEMDMQRTNLYLANTSALPAIDNELQLNGAAGNTTTYDMRSFWSGIFGIGASLAGVAPEEGPLASAGLWVAAELTSMIPSASPTSTSTFQTTYAGLSGQFATIVAGAQKALNSQNLQVRADLGLMMLVAQLRTSGTWSPNWDGMASAARQGAAVWAYQALLPTMYARYAITNCSNSYMNYECGDLPGGPYVTNSSGTSATWLGPGPYNNPCEGEEEWICDYAQVPGTIPTNVANIVWGPLSATCDYQPSNPNTTWIYGCSLGVSIATSIGANGPGWNFVTETGSPVVEPSDTSAAPAVVPAVAAAAGSPARAARNVLGPLRFTGRTFLARRLRLRKTSVVVERTLFENGRREELALLGKRPFALNRRGGGLFTTARNGLGVRLQLRRAKGQRVASLDLRLTGVRTRDLRAICTVLPATVSPAGRTLDLETRLRLREGSATTGVIVVRNRWRCVRDRKGEFSGIKRIKPPRVAKRSGLALKLGVPRVSESRRAATVPITVFNRRRGRPRDVAASLWDLRIIGSAGGRRRTLALKELRASRSRTLRLTLPVPSGERRKVCVRVAAGAASARDVSARRCARIAAAPRVGG